MPIMVAAPSKARTVFVRSNAGIVVSNPTHGMDVCVRLFCVYVVCVAATLRRAITTPRGPTVCVKKDYETEEEARAPKRAAETLMKNGWMNEWTWPHISEDSTQQIVLLFPGSNLICYSRQYHQMFKYKYGPFVDILYCNYSKHYMHEFDRRLLESKSRPRSILASFLLIFLPTLKM
jgi:hypothetical protein